ncbi:NERD domain-containing protein, partial [Candidatus Bathyarchaeota archaeon]|nr:NERD domain-containing protein [Candidatus Bathyarchaeota archaeon]
FYLHKYRIYSGGWEGEKSVAKLLSKTLSDDYYLINDVYLHDGGGDIDHIVLGPNGVFVLETKNWSGKITCNGDQWQRPGKRGFKGSPSRQVKRNAAKIRNIIDSSQLKPLGIRVEGIVVFTNNHSSLNVNNPTVPILKLQQLPSHMTAQKTYNSYTSQQLEQIGKEILKQTH